MATDYMPIIGIRASPVAVRHTARRICLPAEGRNSNHNQHAVDISCLITFPPSCEMTSARNHLNTLLLLLLLLLCYYPLCLTDQQFSQLQYDVLRRNVGLRKTAETVVSCFSI